MEPGIPACFPLTNGRITGILLHMLMQHYNYHYVQTHWVLIYPPLNDWYPSNTFFAFFSISVIFIFVSFVKLHTVTKAEDFSCCVKSMSYHDRQPLLCSSGALGSHNLLYQFRAVTSPRFPSLQQWLLPSQYPLNEQRKQRTRKIASNRFCSLSKSILLLLSVLNTVWPD